MKKPFSILTIIFFVCLILSLVIKVLAVWGNNFPITYDQGRDLVDLRQMVVTHSPRLVGPTTSINGVLLGPFYYYFLLIPFVVFGGNPMALVIWQIIWFQIAVVILWQVLRKKDPMRADIIGILLSLIPTGFYTARYFWNANTMPIFTLLFFASLIFFLEKPALTRSFLVGLLSGLSFQLEAAFGILFFPFALFYFLVKRISLKNIAVCFFGFLITLIPQAVFELRHGFLMTKILLDQISGKGDMLGVKMRFSERLAERGQLLIETVRNTSHIPLEILNILYPVLLILGIYLFIKRKKTFDQDRTILLSLSFFLLSCIFYLLFPMQVKGWYILSLTIPLVMIFGGILGKFFESGKIGKLFVYLFISLAFYNTLKAHIEYLQKNFERSAGDPSNLINELKAVDWVYQKANGNGFRVYSFLPAVYDFPFQHAFWWYGTKKYGYQPEDIAYLPDQPEYIPKGSLAWTKKRATVNGTPVFLIIQTDSGQSDRFQKWMGNFSKLCQTDKTQIIDSLGVLELSTCSVSKALAK